MDQVWADVVFLHWRVDPAEVAETAWVPWADLHEAVTRTPMVFSPWMVLQLLALGPDLPLPATPESGPRP